MTVKRWLIAVVIGAILGFSIFAAMVARVSSFERIAPDGAGVEIEAVRATFENPVAVITTDSEGGLIVETAPGTDVESIETMHVLVYQGEVEGLARVDIPVWFLRLKDPAIQFALRGTGVNLRELGITLKDLQAHGPRIVLDEKRLNGDHVLIWTSGPRQPQ